MILESRELTKKFGSVLAADRISLSLDKGHICAMLGPNGSGKTTWMKMAAGLLKPTSGEVYYNGKPVGIESRKEIAYVSTEPYFYNWMKVIDAGKYYLAKQQRSLGVRSFLNKRATSRVRPCPVTVPNFSSFAP